jgi:hypothetical protein
MKHLWLILLAGLTGGSLGTAGTGTAGADISGTLEFSIDLTSDTTRGTKQGSKIVTFIIEQQGEKLTGTCCAGEEKITGIVRGNEVTFERKFSGEGKGRTITWSGTIETSSKMTGTLRVIEDALQFQRRWTATRKER